MSLVSQMAPEMKTAMDASLRWHDDYGWKADISRSRVYQPQLP